MIVHLVERGRAEKLRHPGVGLQDLASLGVEVCSHGRKGHDGCGTEAGNDKVMSRPEVWEKDWLKRGE